MVVIPIYEKQHPHTKELGMVGFLGNMLDETSGTAAMENLQIPDFIQNKNILRKPWFHLWYPLVIQHSYGKSLMLNGQIHYTW